MFENDRLTKTCEPPPFEVDIVPYKGARREIRRSVDPFRRMALVMSAKDLTGEQLEMNIRKKLAPKSTDPNILPAFIILSPMLIPGELLRLPAVASA